MVAGVTTPAGSVVNERSSWASDGTRVDPVVEAMDRLDAELVLDQLTDVGHGELGVGVGATGLRSTLVAVGPADGVSVVAVGDEHGAGSDGGRDGGDPVGVVDPFDAMGDAVHGDLSDGLGRRGRAARTTPR